MPETATLDDVLAAMQRSQTHMTVVVDEHGGTAGIVTIEDLFEEVVGEIDEGAPSSPPIAPNPDGSVRVAGTLRLDELGRDFHLDLEHEEVESVSGLILARLGRPPVVDDVVEYGRIRLQVTAVSGRGCERSAGVAVMTSGVVFEWISRKRHPGCLCSSRSPSLNPLRPSRD